VLQKILLSLSKDPLIPISEELGQAQGMIIEDLALVGGQSALQPLSRVTRCTGVYTAPMEGPGPGRCWVRGLARAE
jgi:hypothetical protein